MPRHIAFASGDAAGEHTTLRSAVASAAALEWRAFIGHHTSSSYLGAMRSLAMAVANDNRDKRLHAAVRSIDWGRVPKSAAAGSSSGSSSRSGSSSDDDDDGSDSSGSGSEDGDGVPDRTASASAVSAGGGFVSAASLAPRSATTGSTGARSTAAPARRTLLATSFSSSGAATSSTGFQTARTGLQLQVPSSKAPSSAATAKPLSSYFSAGSKSSALPPRTPPRQQAKLALSYVSSSSAANGLSPPRPAGAAIGALPLTRVGGISSPARSASPQQAHSSGSSTGSPRKRPRLDLTSSSRIRPNTHDFSIFQSVVVELGAHTDSCRITSTRQPVSPL